MASKTSFNSFSQLAAAANFGADTEESTAQDTSVDTTGEDLGDVTDTTSDEREHEDTIGGLNDDATEEEEPAPEPVKGLNDRDVQSWTEEELEAYITGQMEVDVYYSTVEKAIAELRIRNTKLPSAWTVAECQEFLTSGLEPSKTTKDAWVKDATRASRREHEWTTQELESWALGEIQPEGNTLAAGLAIELKRRLQLSVPSVDVDAVIQCYKVKVGLVKPQPAVTTVSAAQPAAVAKVAAVVTEPQAKVIYEGITEMNQSYIEGSLAKFHELMRPGKAVSPAIGGEAQKLLKEVITYAISLPEPTAANAAMRLLFDHFVANRADGKIFEDTYAFRFIEDMRAPAKEQESHAALLTLFLAYADPLTELRAQTDVSSLIRGVPTRLQSRVLEFFSKL